VIRGVLQYSNPEFAVHTGDLAADGAESSLYDLLQIPLWGHHPPMTAASNRQGDNPHMTALEPMFEQMHVSAAFFGHDHNYQHYLKNGAHYVIAGGGGAPLYDVDKPPQGITVKAQSIENFVRAQVDGKAARLVAMAADGSNQSSMRAI
jgi:hypothetical protein